MRIEHFHFQDESDLFAYLLRLANINGVFCNWTLIILVFSTPLARVCMMQHQDIMLPHCVVNFQVDNLGGFREWCRFVHVFGQATSRLHVVSFLPGNRRGRSK